jgi:hypothetical protein
MTSSEDRYVKPAKGADPRDIDRELTDADVVARREAERAVSHPQPRERQQGTSADSPGFDPSDRERTAEAAPSGEEGVAEQPS